MTDYLVKVKFSYRNPSEGRGVHEHTFSVSAFSEKRAREIAEDWCNKANWRMLVATARAR